MAKRSRAREVVLQVLYQYDLNPSENLDELESFLDGRLHGESALIDFARSLVQGVLRNRDEIDQMLQQRATNWSLARMAAIDRNILRLGAYEVLFTETPPRVGVNEAVELAKRFGARQSPQFVNGLLDGFVKTRES